MKIVMNNERVCKLIKKYQKENNDFEGELKFVSEKYHDMRDQYVVIKAIMTGKIEIEGEKYDLIQEMDEDKIKMIIKYFIEKNGYKAGNMKFTSVASKNKKLYPEDDPILIFDNVEIEIPGKVKRIGDG